MDNTPGDKLGVWRDMRLANALVQFYSQSYVLFVTLYGQCEIENLKFNPLWNLNSSNFNLKLCTHDYVIEIRNYPLCNSTHTDHGWTFRQFFYRLLAWRLGQFALVHRCRLFVCLSPKCKKTWFSQKLSNIRHDLYWRPIGSRWAFQCITLS